MLKTYNPTSPGIRFRKTLKVSVSKKEPERALKKPIKGPSGRGGGKVTVRDRQRGAKKNYRIIDFKRNKRGIPAKVVAIEYDPNRGPNLALLHYADGEKRYILAPEGLKEGMVVLAGEGSEIAIGNALPLKLLPLGMALHNIEINLGKGGQLARGAGNSAVITAKEGGYVNMKLPSGEVKKISGECYATIGTLGNAEIKHIKLGKAGIKRHLGWRPHTRGVAFSNPSDHPHGGSYKTSGVGMHPKTPWGKKARGVKTRKRMHTNKYKVQDRRVKR